MSFWDDDFYSTRVKRRTRKESSFGQGSSYGRSFRSGSGFRVALVSSLVSSLLVATVFTFAIDRPSHSASHPVTANGLTVTSQPMVAAAAKIRPTVVSIINRPGEPTDAERDSLPMDGVENSSLGSGVIFEKKGGKAHIITNAHVVEGSGSLEIVMVNGTTKDAKVLGMDTITDLAVLEVDAKDIDAVAKVGKSADLQEGETVIALGNPLGLSDSLTDGIVSNLRRIIPVSLSQDGTYDWEEEVIQISAPINPGNSGGGLFNLNGEVVGINSMKIADLGVEGIGFAIPIDDAMPVVKQLLEEGKVPRPYLGVYAIDLKSYLDTQKAMDMPSLPSLPDGEEFGQGSQGEDGESEDGVPSPVVPDGVENGVLVLEAVGPAKEAGLKLNDIIVGLDDKPVNSMMDLRKYLYNSKKIGDTLSVTYYRDGKKQELSVKLAENSDDNE
ncbi:trypsin-like peptidase domain-containing protein [Cohnella lubricantis]|uniref:Trypsin-like peptidase domain-containing protein n=1 Tax=Cohnella lubricantis TaxID=2163172 RepID=A0A841TE05_9BACL|nr:trypsin-like peptidase domain-containing protein [Cohnella lubricantis]MBB6679514.1 trypsin-like peptidase domain-containing protein [Cohnella lubricantis]MBP2119266.1 serine protease Do [Cohnella lubricantis]